MQQPQEELVRLEAVSNVEQVNNQEVAVPVSEYAHVNPQLEQLKNSQSSSSSDAEVSEEDNKDHMIYAEYVKVNRTRTKFKCDFRNAFIFINGKEYVAKTLSGDFTY